MGGLDSAEAAARSRRSASIAQESADAGREKRVVAQIESAPGHAAYRAMYENSPDGVLFTAPDGRVLAANPAACQVLARSEAEICSLGRQGMADATDDRWGLMLEERERTGQVRGVARMIRGDGALIEAEMSARIFHEADGTERACTIFRDVTDRVAMERELRDGRKRLAEAERVAQIGSWEWDVASDRVSWSNGLFEIYGLSPDEFDSSLADSEKRVYSEDRARVRETFQQALKAPFPLTLEYRGVRYDGTVRTLRSRVEVVVNEQGEPIRLVGAVQDITETRRAEQVLQSASSDLQRKAIELRRLALGTDAEQNQEPHMLLTSRQLEVMRLVAQGMTSAQIAKRLFLTEGTVKWHVKQILAKSGSSNRAEAVARIFGPSQ